MNKFIYHIKAALKPNARNIISIFSLALGLALSLVLWGSAMYDRSYDSFHKDKDRLYSLNRSYNDEESWGVPDITSQTLKSEMPDIEDATRFISREITYKIDNNVFSLVGMAIDTSFFDVLSFEVLKGNPREDFKELRTIYLSESKAFELFGDNDPIEKTLIRDSIYIYTVKGIFKDFPKNSIISYSYGNNKNEIDFLESLNQYKLQESWYGGVNFSVIRLQDGVSQQDAEDKIKHIVDANYDPIVAAEKNQSMKILLTPIDDEYRNISYVLIMIMITSFMALLLVIATALNYSLISISSLGARLKEFAVRKYSGASRLQIVGIIFIQTTIQTFVALGLAAVFIIAFREQIEMFLAPIDIIFSINNLLNSLFVVVIIIVASAIIPSIIFANISVISLFRKSRNSHQTWKKIMLFIQLLLSVAIVLLAVMAYMQYDYMINKDIGYKYDNLVYFNTKFENKSDYTKFKNELMKLSFVEDVTFSNGNIMHGFGGMEILEDGTSLFHSSYLTTSENFFDLLEMEIINGEPYRDGGDFYDVVVNEKFVEKINWDRDKSVIGKTFSGRGDKLYRVVGVVKNFYSGYDEIVDNNHYPIVMSPNISIQKIFLHTFITLKLSEMSKANYDAIVETMNKLNIKNVHISTYQNRRDFNFIDVKKPIYGIAMAGIIIFLITIIGLYGYIGNELQYKHREIALRKVYGASVFNIIKIIYRPILIILLIAIPLGVVGGYFGGYFTINSSLPYVITLPWWVFVLVPLCIVIVTYMIVVLRTYRIATKNPIKPIHE